MKKVLGIVFILFVSLSLKAQDVHTELEKINQAYAKITCFELQYTQSFFADSAQSIPSESLITKIKVSGANKYYQKGNTELFLYNNVQVVVDKDDKSIYVAPYKIIAGANTDPMLGVANQISKYLKMCAVAKVVKLNATTNQILLRGCSSERINLTLEYNSSNYTIKKVTTTKDNHAGARSRSVVVFGTLNSKASIASSEFNASKYIVKSTKGYQLQSAYIAYELIDTTN